MTAARELELTPMTFDDFVELERNSDIKHEIWGDTLVAMAGGTEEHNDIATNMLRELSNAHLAGGCKPFGSDQMVFAPGSGKGYYPDVSAVCGPREFREEKNPEERRVLLNPTLVVEVLSRSTAKRDLATKFDYYASIPSLREYVVIDPTTPWLRTHLRTDAGWRLISYSDLSQTVRFESVAIEISMSRIYFGVSVAESSRIMDADNSADDPE